MRDHWLAVMVQTLLQVNFIYNPSERMTLSDTQEALRLASMKDQGNNDDGHSASKDENRDETADYTHVISMTCKVVVARVFQQEKLSKKYGSDII